VPIYFDKHTEQSIIKYNTETDINIKNEIYTNEIHKAFDKLVENLINTYKFRGDTNYIALKQEAVADLYIKLNKYDPTRLTKGGLKVKAYSYFGTIAKNFIMLNWKKSRKLDLFDFQEHSNVINEYESISRNEILLKTASHQKEELFSNNTLKSKMLKFISIRRKELQTNIKYRFMAELGRNNYLAMLNVLEQILIDDFSINYYKQLFEYIRNKTDMKTYDFSGHVKEFREDLKSFLQDNIEEI